MRSLALVLLFVCACSSPPMATGPKFHEDVEPILMASCQGCHAGGGIGPFPLVTYAQAKAQAGAISVAVSTGKMPPWQPAEGCGQPFVDDMHLQQAQIDTLVKWADDPIEGNPANAPTGTAQQPALSRVDAALKMPEPYTPSATLSDDYRCFLIDPALSGTKFITGYDIKPGVTAEVHHVILYTVNRNDAIAADNADPGPGWSCFGGAGVDLVGALGAWAPGAGAVRFPGGTGLALDPQNVIAMQIHYNTKAGVRTPDTTQADLMFADRPVRSALLLPLPASGFNVPPKSTGYNYTKRFKNELGFDLDVWGLLPHMHTWGKKIEMRSDSQCLISIPKWDFSWQRVYFRTKPITIGVTDGITMDCTWDNPGDTSLRWGEKTSDEMCFAFIYTTPH